MIRKFKIRDGKWLFATYGLNGAELPEALYLMRRQRDLKDINKLKSNFSQDKKLLKTVITRTQIIIDSEGKLFQGC